MKSWNFTSSVTIGLCDVVLWKWDAVLIFCLLIAAEAEFDYVWAFWLKVWGLMKGKILERVTVT
jgi:hypothetical protein